MQGSTVLVVGAGIAGLQTARALLKRGFDVLVLEQSDDIGGLWSKRYHGANVGVQVPHQFYQFGEYPWPAHIQKADYPSNQQVYEYVESYAEHFNLLPHIRFNCQLARMQQRKPSGWFVVYLNLDSGYFEEISVDFVVVCSGLNSLPYIPNYPGSKQFKGLQLHAKQFSDAAVCAGKKVVVVGSGKSAVDSSSEVAMCQTAASVTWLFRQPHWPVPRKLSKHLPMEQVVFSTLPNLLLPPYYTSGKLRRFAQGLLRPSQKLAWQAMQQNIQKQFKLEGCLEPGVPLEKDLFYGGQILESTWNQLIYQNNMESKGISSNSSSSADDLAVSKDSNYSKSSMWKGLFKKGLSNSMSAPDLQAFDSGNMDSSASMTSSSITSSSRDSIHDLTELSSCSTDSSGLGINKPKAVIRPLQGEVATFVHNGIYLRGGEFVEADVVLYCTGYTKSYDYLEGSVKARLGIQKDGLYLYRNILAPKVPGLAFVGSEVSTFNNVLTSGLQAEWLGRVLAEEMAVPSPDVMQEDIRQQQQWRRNHIPAQRNRGSVYQLYMVKYHSQLMKDMGFKAPKPGPFNFLKPLDSAHYSLPFTTAPANRGRCSFSSDDSADGFLYSTVSNFANFEGQKVAHSKEVCEAAKQQVKMEVSAVELKQRTAATEAAAALLQGAPEGTSAAAAVAAAAAAGATAVRVDHRVARTLSGDLYVRASSGDLYVRQNSGDLSSEFSSGVHAVAAGATGVVPPQVPVGAAIGKPATLRRNSQPESPVKSAVDGDASQISAPLLRLDTRGSLLTFPGLSGTSAPLPKLRASGFAKMGSGAAMLEGGANSSMTPFGHRVVQQQGALDRGAFRTGSNVNGIRRMRTYHGSDFRASSAAAVKGARRVQSCHSNLTTRGSFQLQQVDQLMRMNTMRKSDESNRSGSVPSDDWCEVPTEPGPLITVPQGWGKGSLSAKQGVPSTVFEGSISCSTDEAEISGAFVIKAQQDAFSSPGPKTKGVVVRQNSGLSKKALPSLSEQQQVEKSGGSKVGKLLGLPFGRKGSSGSPTGSFSSAGGGKGLFSSFTKARSGPSSKVPNTGADNSARTRSAGSSTSCKAPEGWPGLVGMPAGAQQQKQDPLAPVRQLVMQLQEHAEMERERFQREQGARATAACLGASLGDKRSSRRSVAPLAGNAVGPRVRFAAEGPVTSAPAASSEVSNDSITLSFPPSQTGCGDAITPPAAATEAVPGLCNKASTCSGSRDAIHNIGPAALAGAAEQAMRVHKQGAARNRLGGATAAVAAALGPESSEFQAISDWMDWVNGGGSSSLSRTASSGLAADAQKDVAARRRSSDCCPTTFNSSSRPSSTNSSAWGSGKADGADDCPIMKRRLPRRSRSSRGLEAFQPQTAAPLLSLQELQAASTAQSDVKYTSKNSEVLPIGTSGQQFYKKRETKSLDLGSRPLSSASVQSAVPRSALDTWVEHV